eukprot:jgi/Chlat1/6116/Chrsp409S05664
MIQLPDQKASRSSLPNLQSSGFTEGGLAIAVAASPAAEVEAAEAQEDGAVCATQHELIAAAFE